MASKDELSHSEWHDSDSGRRRFLWRHGWKFLRARHSKRAEIVGTEPSRRDRRWRHYLLDQRNTKDRRRERFDRNSVANRNHNRQSINTWIGVARRRIFREKHEASSNRAQQQKPNILFILGDEKRSIDETPNWRSGGLLLGR